MKTSIDLTGINASGLKSQFTGNFVTSSVKIPSLTQYGSFITDLIKEIAEFDPLVVAKYKKPVKQTVQFCFGGIIVIVEIIGRIGMVVNFIIRLVSGAEYFDGTGWLHCIPVK